MVDGDGVNMTTNLIGRIACAIGLHSMVRRDIWKPSIYARPVTEFEQTHICDRCGKMLHHIHIRWNGEEMINVVKPH